MTVTTHRGGSLCSTDISYVIYPQGIVDIDAAFDPQRDDLRRAGVAMGIDSALSMVDYYALGPWENSNDRADGTTIGRYTSTVGAMDDKYMKPQSAGSRGELREVAFTDPATGYSLLIQAEGPVTFSAMRNDDTQLMNAMHPVGSHSAPLHLSPLRLGVSRRGQCLLRPRCRHNARIPCAREAPLLPPPPLGIDPFR